MRNNSINIFKQISSILPGMNVFKLTGSSSTKDKVLSDVAEAHM